MDIVSKEQVIEFFDVRAEKWDDFAKNDESVTHDIIGNLGQLEGKKVLDIGCGTGYMIPYYLEAGAKKVTGVDISAEMLGKAGQKFKDHSKVDFVNGDAEQLKFDEKYDICVIYNAFPHFPSPEALLHNLWAALTDNGSICIAHGASRAVIDGCHAHGACHVSRGLPSDQEFHELLEKEFDIKTFISDERMIELIGIKK
ncbi:MAG: class I SAM-dependent methyltransferase [Butyrivibrio sp.]|nr:class I SAM-dependent methyltransferase [Butyrivibrio sp.]